MASITINASMQRAHSSRNIKNKQQFLVRSVRSLETNQSIPLVSQNVDGQKVLNVDESHLKPIVAEKTTVNMDKIKHNTETEPSVSKFFDERWKNGTWDLNMFIKNGKMDWDGVIVAEARRRKYLELNPEVSTEEDPVHFRTSIVPWWAWIMHSHLPEAELLNGRAAMVGFFMSYFVDALTGLDVVGQTGNFICKVGLLGTVIGVLLLRRNQDFEKLQKLADEATFYDNQWKASWEDQGGKNS